MSSSSAQYSLSQAFSRSCTQVASLERLSISLESLSISWCGCKVRSRPHRVYLFPGTSVCAVVHAGRALGESFLSLYIRFLVVQFNRVFGYDLTIPYQPRFSRSCTQVAALEGPSIIWYGFEVRSRPCRVPLFPGTGVCAVVHSGRVLGESF